MKKIIEIIIIIIIFMLSILGCERVVDHHDYTAPEIQITNPADGDTLKQNITVQVEAYDENGIDRVEFYINSRILIGIDNTEPYSCSLEICYFTYSEEHTLYAKAYDNEGNYSTSQYISIKIEPSIIGFPHLIYPSDEYMFEKKFIQNFDLYFMWNKVEQADHYKLIISKDLYFDEQYSSIVVEDTVFVINDNFDNITYYWLVQVLDEENTVISYSHINRVDIIPGVVLRYSEITHSVSLIDYGGYVVTGRGYYDFLVLRMNESGELDWKKFFGDSGWSEAYSVIQAEDGCFVVTGFTYEYKQSPKNAWVLKIDPAGNLLWEKELGINFSATGNSIKETIDNGYIVTGSIEYDDSTNTDLWLLMLDSDGNKEWDITFGGLGDDYGNSVLQLEDGSFIVCGSTYSYDVQGSDFLIVKFDENGNKLWYKTYGGKDYEKGNSIIRGIDNGYVIVGTSRHNNKGIGRDIKVLKIDDDGLYEWDSIYTPGYYNFGNDITIAHDQGYIIAGESDLNVGHSNNLLILKIDNYGNQLWYKDYGDERGYDEACSIKQTSDGGYIVAGATGSYSRNEGHQVGWIMKIDEAGCAK